MHTYVHYFCVFTHKNVHGAILRATEKDVWFTMMETQLVHCSLVGTIKNMTCKSGKYAGSKFQVGKLSTLVTTHVKCTANLSRLSTAMLHLVNTS